ncbi:hypothetical protein [Halobacillus alkaliphilus]|nr:hypothetical protein [Halobacillus alkaliphilus]
MKTRSLGKTGIQVSEVGFGAWQLGNEKDWGKMCLSLFPERKIFRN